APLENLLVAHLPALDAGLLGGLHDELFDDRIRNGCAITRLVFVPSRARLLTEPAELTDLIGNLGIAHVRRTRGRLPLTDVPAHIEPGKIADAKWTHGKAKVLDYFVHLLR